MEIAQRYDVPGVPALRFLTADGKEIKNLRANGPVKADAFDGLLDLARLPL